MKAVGRSRVESTHMYRQMLQREPQRVCPFREGVHHRGACILEREAV